MGRGGGRRRDGRERLPHARVQRLAGCLADRRHETRDGGGRGRRAGCHPGNVGFGTGDASDGRASLAAGVPVGVPGGTENADDSRRPRRPRVPRDSEHGVPPEGPGHGARVHRGRGGGGCDDRRRRREKRRRKKRRRARRAVREGRPREGARGHPRALAFNARGQSAGKAERGRRGRARRGRGRGRFAGRRETGGTRQETVRAEPAPLDDQAARGGVRVREPPRARALGRAVAVRRGGERGELLPAPGDEPARRGGRASGPRVLERGGGKRQTVGSRERES